MLKQFLVKEISNTLDRKLNIESQLRENNMELNEINEHIRLIKQGMNQSETIFRPGSVVSNDERLISELKQKKKSITEDNVALQSIIDDLNDKLDEIQKVYDYVNKAEQYDNLEKYGKNFVDKSEETSYLQMLEIQEMERQRIARDLHDSVVQNLTNIVHKVEFSSMIMSKDPIKAKLEMKTIEKNVRDVISEMRDVIYNLRPMSFDDIGIETTVERELARLQNLSGIKFKYSTVGEFKKIDPVIELTLFRIIQEACNNAIKHSKATEISVTMIYSNDTISLKISDNGCGFDPNSIPTKRDKNSKNGFGISMMKERVFLLSGKINITSNGNEGTTILVDVPLDL